MSKLGLGKYLSTQGMEQNFDRGNIGDVRLEQGGSPLPEGLLAQCKKGKRPSVWKAVEQAEEASEDTACLPVAVVWRDRGSPQGTGSEPVVAMRPETFAALVSGQEVSL